MIRSVWLVCGGIWLSCSAAWAGGKIDADSSSVQLTETLRQESAAGGGTDRRALLSDALEDDGNSAAWWQSGYVSSSAGWQSWEQSSLVETDLLQRYQQKRDEAPLTAAAQLKLADWCREQGLADQERTHLIIALRTGMAPNPPGILKRLGYRQVGANWFTEAELAKTSNELTAIVRQTKRLRPRLENLAERLERHPIVRDKALAELQSLTNRESVWLIEQLLAGRSENAAQALVDMLSHVKSYQASQALARLAVFNPWDTVRASATGELKKRRWEDFVPGLLEFLQEPIRHSSTEAIRHPAGNGLQEWRFLWAREGRHSIEVACSHLLYFRDVPAAPLSTHGQSPFERHVLRLKDQVAATDFVYFSQSRTEAANEQIDETNKSIIAVLTAVTGLPAMNSPTDWWDWWDGTTDQLTDSDLKPVVIVAEEFQSFGLPEIELQPLPSRSPPPERSTGRSCLVAGTPVWTEEGFRPIEDIRIGDRVLSKSIETGELKYQPVLHTTHRAGATVSQLKVGDETIDASLGHNFWISGRGWTRTNQLRDGMPAHTPTGTVCLEVDDQTRTADVYNLVVADFHTYFVGKSMLLGHDVIVPAPTDIRVPGLEPQMAAAK